jgi:hypothetical protein
MLANVKSLKEMADRALAFDKLTDIEKTRLEQKRNRLADAIKSLVDIFKAHDAHDPLHLGPLYLNTALQAAFTIGNQAIQNPIIRRFKTESAKHASQARLAASKLIDDVIEKKAAPYWKLGEWTDHRIAGKIGDDVNKERRLQKKKLNRDAIRKRIKKLRPKN